MKLKELFTEERAVSPVVGVALLIAIAVILAAVIGAVVLGLGTGGAEVPQAQLSMDVDDDNVTVMHASGEPLPEEEVRVEINGNEADTPEDGELDSALTAGGETNFEFDDWSGVDNAEDVDRVTVIWDEPGTDTEHTLEERDF